MFKTLQLQTVPQMFYEPNNAANFFTSQRIPASSEMHRMFLSAPIPEKKLGDLECSSYCIFLEKTVIKAKRGLTKY